MENASKALIIAGAILLSILIIALGIYVFNMAKGATNTDQLDAVQKQAFNNQFTQYKGNQNGNVVKELLNICVSNCDKYAEDEDRLPDIVYIETRKGNAVWQTFSARVGFGIQNVTSSFSRCDGSSTTGSELISEAGLSGNVGEGSFSMPISVELGKAKNTKLLSNLRNEIAEGHTYKIGYCINSSTGLVDCLVIKY